MEGDLSFIIKMHQKMEKISLVRNFREAKKAPPPTPLPRFELSQGCFENERTEWSKKKY